MLISIAILPLTTYGQANANQQVADEIIGLVKAQWAAQAADPIQEWELERNAWTCVSVVKVTPSAPAEQPNEMSRPEMSGGFFICQLFLSPVPACNTTGLVILIANTHFFIGKNAADYICSLKKM